MRLKDAQNVTEHAKNIPEGEGRRRTSIKYTSRAQYHGYSSFIRFISAASPLVLCMYKFVLNIFLFIIIFLSFRPDIRMENNNWSLNTNNGPLHGFPSPSWM